MTEAQQQYLAATNAWRELAKVWQVRLDTLRLDASKNCQHPGEFVVPLRGSTIAGTVDKAVSRALGVRVVVKGNIGLQWTAGRTNE